MPKIRKIRDCYEGGQSVDKQRKEIRRNEVVLGAASAPAEVAAVVASESTDSILPT